MRVSLSIGMQSVHIERSKQLAAFMQDSIEPAKGAQPELAFALDRDHTRMRQLRFSVTFEFNSLLEIDEIQLDLIGGVLHCQACNQDVQQRALPGAGSTDE